MFDESQEEPITSFDTPNSTKFNVCEAPKEQQSKYTRFSGYNTGVYNGFWADNTELRRLDNLALYDAVSSQLELTRFQKKTGRLYFDRLDLQSYGTRAELVAFVVCAYVCQRDRRFYDPEMDNSRNDSLFLNYAINLPEPTERIRSTYKHVVSDLNEIKLH